MKIKCVKVVSFICILIAALYMFNAIFCFKYGDGIYSIKKFYEQKKYTVDVLVLGSSHAFEDVNTAVLWQQYGIASYDMCGSMQPMWNSYFYLKEALKTQQPKVVVLEAYMTTFQENYSDDSRIIKNTFGMKWSKNKFEAISVSVPKERRKEFLLEYAQYHSRYPEITKEDFLKNQGNNFFTNWKGFGCNTDTVEFEKPDITDVIDRAPMTEKSEEYYRKIIELAQSNDIPISIVVSPYPGITEQQQKIYNYASDIAAEYSVAFINYNLYVDDIGLNYSEDFADQDHLNYKGNQKYSSVLGDYLIQNYTLKDRRDDEEYMSWENGSQYMMDFIDNQYLKNTTDISEIGNYLLDDQYSYIISFDGTCTTSDSNVRPIVENVEGLDENVNGIYVVESGKVTKKVVGDDSELYFTFDKHDVILKRNEVDGTMSNSVCFDNAYYKKVGNGINVIVYSKTIGEIVDTFAFDMDSNYACIR